jgi:putative transposase
MSHKYAIQLLCEIAEVSRAGYYKWKATEKACKVSAAQDADLKEHTLAIHRLHPYYGYQRMRKALRREGLGVNAMKFDA